MTDPVAFKFPTFALPLTVRVLPALKSQVKSPSPSITPELLYCTLVLLPWAADPPDPPPTDATALPPTP